MRTFYSLLISIPFALGLNVSGARANPDDAVPAQTAALVKTFAKARSWTQLLGELPDLALVDRLELAPILANQRVPKVTQIDDYSIKIDNNVLTIMSVKNRDIRFNGKYIKIPEQAGLKGIFKLLLKETRTETARFQILRGLFETAHAKSGELTNIDRLIAPDWYLNMQDPTRPVEYEDSWLAMMGAGAVYAPAGAAFMGAYVVDKVTDKAMTATAQSCEASLKEAKSLMEDRKIAIEKWDCGSNFRKNDRSISFWVPGPQGKPVKRSFVYDERAGILQENISKKDKAALDPKKKDPKKKNGKKKDDDDDDDEDGLNKTKVGYFFGTGFLASHYASGMDQLSRIRIVQPGNMEKEDIFGKSNIGTDERKKFDRMQKEIEPIRQVLFYLGKNRVCEQCQEQTGTLRNKEAPAYIKGKSMTVPQELRTYQPSTWEKIKDTFRGTR